MFYVRHMRQEWQRHIVWFDKVSNDDLRRVLSRIRRYGAITIRDIDNDVLVEKDYAWASRKPSKRALEVAFYKGLELIPVQVEGAGQSLHWVRPDALDAIPDPAREQIHILSPFDPLIIQRKRLRLFFDYEYRFEAHVPKHKRER
jgi:uncharacterized protein YcaQ